MSSLSVKRSNNNLATNCNLSKSKLKRGKNSNSTNNKTKSTSLKSRIFRLLFNVKDDNDDINNNDNMDSNNDTNKRGLINKTDDDKNKAVKINPKTVDGLEVDEENREFISYKDIKAIFDEIDRKFGECQDGEKWSEKYQQYQQYGNNFTNNSLTNCEMQSPVK